MQRSVLPVDDPYRGDRVAEIPLLGADEARQRVRRSARAQAAWADRPLEERMALCEGTMEAFEANGEAIARNVSRQMGKPIAQSRQEVLTCLARARRMIELAPAALAPREIPAGAGQLRRISREPVGVVLDIAAWNYPLLIAANVVIPAVLAGDAVLLKHAARTPLCADAFADAFADAGAPDDLVLPFPADHETVALALSMPEIGYASFTGSVRGGHEVYLAVARRFIDAGLELGGKDPAYVAEDADLDAAIEGLADGSFYNAGQSCCGIERIYVHRSLHERFVEGLVAAARRYEPGDPLDAHTSLGPLADPRACELLSRQIGEALSLGATLRCGGARVRHGPCDGFFAPTVIDHADHRMELMREESFGPLVGVQPVASDEEAIEKMNDSRYGLTASIWSRDPERGLRIGARLQAGTIYLNRCDFLDPSLAWTGVRDSGKGTSLSAFGFLPLTRPKSWNFSFPNHATPG